MKVKKNYGVIDQYNFIHGIVAVRSWFPNPSKAFKLSLESFTDTLKDKPGLECEVEIFCRL